MFVSARAAFVVHFPFLCVAQFSNSCVSIVSQLSQQLQIKFSKENNICEIWSFFHFFDAHAHLVDAKCFTESLDQCVCGGAGQCRDNAGHKICCQNCLEFIKFIFWQQDTGQKNRIHSRAFAHNTNQMSKTTEMNIGKLDARNNDEDSFGGNLTEVNHPPEPLLWDPSLPRSPPTGKNREEFLKRNTRWVPQLHGVTWSEFELRVWEREWKDHQETLQWHRESMQKQNASNESTLHMIDKPSCTDKTDPNRFKKLFCTQKQNFFENTLWNICNCCTKVVQLSLKMHNSRLGQIVINPSGFLVFQTSHGLDRVHQ